MQLLLFLWISHTLLGINEPNPSHKFYVSTTEIEFKEDSKSLQITSQLFIDDIELQLRSNQNDLKLAPDSNAVLVDSLLRNYFENALQFSAQGKEFNFTFLGKEYKNDVVQCYLELQFEEVPVQIELKNTLLLNLFEEQQNIVHFKFQGQRKSFLLHQKKPSVSLSLSP